MKRYKFIDISKGIGITLVVLYHAPSIGEISHIGTFYWGGVGINILHAFVLFA